MGIRPEPCYRVDCDTCGQPVQDDEVGTLHFPSELSAREYIAESGDWTIIAGRTLCPGCIQVAGCQAVGHQWGAWDVRPITGMTSTPVALAWRMCTACGDHEFAPVVPPRGQP